MQKAGARINRAYCIEARRIVDIFEARDFYFDAGERKLSFLCSNEDCRAKGIRVTGVNYHHHLDATYKYVRPHFREEDEHLLDCEWVLNGSAIADLQKEELTADALNVCRRFRYAKSGDIIDVFEPPVTAQDIDRTEAANIRDKAVPAKTQSRDRVEYLKTRLRLSPHKSGRLSLLVRSYLDLGEEDRKAALVQVPGDGKVAYKQLFRKVKSWNPNVPNRVSYARVGLVENTGRSIRIHVTEGVMRPDSPKESGKQTFHPTMIELDLAIISGQRGHKSFLKELDMCEKTAVMVYTYGTFERDGETYVSRPALLSNVVLIPYSETVPSKKSK